MANTIDPDYVITGLEKKFSESDEVVPNNVGYYSIDTKKLRIGDGITKWSDIVPFVYSEESIKIVNDWNLSKDQNVPSAIIVKDRFEILENVSGDHSEAIDDYAARIKSLENDHTPISHTFRDNSVIKYGISTANDYGHTRLSDSTSSTSGIAGGIAATPKAVATVNTTATEALSTANAAMPKIGGTFTGHVNNSSYYTCTGTSPYYRTVTNSITRGTAPNADTTTTSFRITDSKGVLLSNFRNVYYTSQENRTDMLVYSGLTTDNTASRISIGYDKSGKVYTYAPTPAITSTPNTNIATTKYVSEYVAHNQNPIGTIIMYWGSSAPDGYLICNGASINQTSYPELYKLCNGVLPDLRHRFIRGASTSTLNIGGTAYPARKVGLQELDAGRNITGRVRIRADLETWNESNSALYSNNELGDNGRGSTDGSCTTIKIDASRVWGSTHTSNEFRPLNVAVLFCIKHD